MDTEVAERLRRIEQALAELKPPVEARVKAIEDKIDALKPRQKDIWERAQALSGIVAAIVAGSVGLYLTGVVGHALEERKLEASATQQMRDTIAALNVADVRLDHAQALGLTLGAFGEFAVPALIAALSEPTLARAEGARTGLLAASLKDRDAVCQALTAVIDNHSKRYRVAMHIDSIELMGKIDCGGPAIASLTAYRARLDRAATDAGRAKFASTVDDRSPVKAEDIEGLRNALCRTTTIRADARCTIPR